MEVQINKNVIMLLDIFHEKIDALALNIVSEHKRGILFSSNIYLILNYLRNGAILK